MPPIVAPIDGIQPIHVLQVHLQSSIRTYDIFETEFAGSTEDMPRGVEVSCLIARGRIQENKFPPLLLPNGHFRRLRS